MAELVGIIIEDYREKAAGQGVVLIGHSMGCSLAALLASNTSPLPNMLSEHAVGLVAICPRGEPPSEDQVKIFKKLLWVPNTIFDLWRRWDRRGGIESASVYRFVGRDADQETKKLQNRFNNQSRTAAWRRMAAGSLPKYENGVAKGGLPGRDVWACLHVPVFLVAGEADNITKPSEVGKIASYLGKSHPIQIELDKNSELIDFAAPLDTSIRSEPANSVGRDIESMQESDFLKADSHDTTSEHEDPSTPNEELSVIPPQPIRPKAVLKTTILPAPASHALLYMPSTVRTLAGLISD